MCSLNWTRIAARKFNELFILTLVEKVFCIKGIISSWSSPAKAAIKLKRNISDSHKEALVLFSDNIIKTNQIAVITIIARVIRVPHYTTYFSYIYYNLIY